MRIVNVRLNCPDTFTELPADDVMTTEMAIECIVSTALLEVFDAVFVDDVTVQPSPEDEDEYGERD